MLSQDFFAEMKAKKTEDELCNIFGKEVGNLLNNEGNCEDKFQ
jgi:hypothetical protein